MLSKKQAQYNKFNGYVGANTSIPTGLLIHKLSVSANWQLPLVTVTTANCTVVVRIVYHLRGGGYGLSWYFFTRN